MVNSALKNEGEKFRKKKIQTQKIHSVCYNTSFDGWLKFFTYLLRKVISSKWPPDMDCSRPYAITTSGPHSLLLHRASKLIPVNMGLFCVLSILHKIRTIKAAFHFDNLNIYTVIRLLSWRDVDI